MNSPAAQSSVQLRIFEPGATKLLEALDLAGIVDGETTFQSLFESTSGIWWFNCFNPCQKDIEVLALSLHLHQFTVDDLLNDQCAQKFENFESYYHVVYTGSQFNTTHIIVTADGVLTVSLGPGLLDTSAIQTRVSQLRDPRGSLRVSSNSICYLILDYLTDSIMPRIDDVEQEAESIEDAVFMKNVEMAMEELSSKMGHARSKSVELMSLLLGKRAVVNSLFSHCSSNRPTSDLYDDDGVGGSDVLMLLTTIMGHLDEMVNKLRGMEDLLARTYVNYISVMRVKLIHSNVTVETAVGVVTLFNVVLLPVHLISSIWTINVPVPGKEVKNESIFWSIVGGYTFITLLCATLAALLYASVLRKNKTKFILRKQEKID